MLHAGCDRYRPFAPRGTDRFVALSAGEDFTCGLARSGEAFCWGLNSMGQLGSADTLGRCAVPAFVVDHHSGPRPPAPCSAHAVPVAGGLRFRALSAGASHACAVALDGAVYCWGANEWGQLGVGRADGGAHWQPEPVVGGLRFASLDAGRWTTCALTPEGRAYCWGHNGDGRAGTPIVHQCPLRDVVVECNLSPTPVSTELRFGSLSVGDFNGCGVTDTLGYCWGSGSMLGDDSASTKLCRPYFRCSTHPTPVAGGLRFRSITAGSFTICGVTATRAAYCWGLNQSDQIGAGVSNTATYHRPTPVVGGLAFDTLALGAMHTCGLIPAGALYCWGYNDYGELGHALMPYRENAPKTPVAGRHRFAAVAAGAWHTCALTREGRSYCWGKGDLGQLGTGRVERAREPEPLAVATPTRR